MNRMKLVWAFGMMLLACGCQSLRSQTVVPMLTNGNFESGRIGSIPEAWSQEDRMKQLGSASLENRPDGQGRALRLRPGARNTNPNEPFGIVQVIRAKDLPSGPLRLSANLAGTDGASPVVLVLPMDAQMKPKSVVNITGRSGNGFQPVSREISAGDAVYLVVACVVAETRGEAWFDDIVLEAAATPTSATTRRVGPTIRVNAANTIRTVSPDLFGTNIEWIYSGNGLWDGGKNELNPSAIATASKAGVSLVRFPGGVFADFYNWRDGIGALNTRPSRQHSPSDKNVSLHAIGTHEIATVARRMGAELMLQVNIVTGTAAEAAAWVAYCNAPVHAERARNGSPSPFRVKYWEIGNENYIRGDSEATRKAYMTPKQYAAKFLEFAAAMKKVDPTIQVGAVGGRNFAKYGFVTDDSWNATVLSQAGSAIDFYAVHNGYAPVAAGESRRSTEDVYRAMFAFPRQVERNLLDLEKEIVQNAGAANAARIKVAVTEWGPYFHVIPSDPFLDHVKTLGSAVYSADLMATFLRTGKTQIANFFKLTDVAWLGWMGLDGVPTPSLLALEMFRRHFGTQIVETTVTSPTFDSPEAGMVAAERNVPTITAIASLSADRRKLYVIAIQKHLSSALDVDVVLEGVNPQQAVTIHSLSGPSFDAHNGQKLPEVPGIKWATPARATTGSAFDTGKPGTVVIRTSNSTLNGGTARLRLQPTSVNAFEFNLR